MRVAVFAALLGVIAPPERPTEVFRGSFKCTYPGTWGCAPPGFPGGICVDGGIRDRDAKRYVLRVNFDTGRIRLNDISGTVEHQTSGHWVSWDVGGMGRPQLSAAGTPGYLMLSHFDQSGSSSRSEFKCIRTPTAEL
jgi:hypothetical protein